MLRALTVFMILLANGCASVCFLEGGEDKGFEYFPAKPYLVVERGKDGAVAKLLSMPDLTRPSRVDYSPGWGTVEFGFDTSHGMITKFNATSDSKATETLTALASLGTAQADLIGAGADLLRAEAEVSDSGSGLAGGPRKFDVYPLVASADMLGDILTTLRGGSPGAKLQLVNVTLGRLAGQLDGLTTVSYDDSAPSRDRQLLDAVAQRRIDIRKFLVDLERERGHLDTLLADVSTPDPDKQAIQVVQPRFSAVVRELREFSRTSAPIEIYELRVSPDDQSIELRRVRFLE